MLTTPILTSCLVAPLQLDPAILLLQYSYHPHEIVSGLHNNVIIYTKYTEVLKSYHCEYHFPHLKAHYNSLNLFTLLLNLTPRLTLDILLKSLHICHIRLFLFKTRVQVHCTLLYQHFPADNTLPAKTSTIAKFSLGVRLSNKVNKFKLL